MLTAVQRAEILQAERHLDAVALAQLTDYLDGLGEIDVDRLIEALLDSVPTMVRDFADVSAELAANAYDLSREQSGAPGRFAAELAPGPAVSQVEGMVRWAISPLFINQDGSVQRTQLQTRLEDATPRLVRQGGRDTTIGNVGRDPARPKFMRVPRPGACGFCLMLTSRGAVYVSEDSAGSVGHQKKRRKTHQSAGSSYHDHCQCRPEAIFPGQSEPEFVAAIQKDFLDTTAGLSGKAAVRHYNAAVRARPQAPAD